MSNNVSLRFLTKYVINLMIDRDKNYKYRNELLLNQHNEKYLTRFEERTKLDSKQAIEDARIYLAQIHKKVFDNLSKLSNTELMSLTADDSFLESFVAGIKPTKKEVRENGFMRY